MLQGRLRPLPAAVAATLLLGACSSVDGTERGAIREAVIEPGITAIGEADELACNGDAATLRTTLEIYEIREGEPAPDEAALVAGDYLRAESELWDVRDGRLVPQDPGCGEVPTDVPAENVTEIVTEDEPTDQLDDFAARVATMTADDILADAGPDEIAEVGGVECAREVAEVGLAFARWSIDRNAEPSSLRQLVDDGYLDPLELWTIGASELTPVAGAACIGPIEMLQPREEPCRVEARTLEVAREAYVTLFPDADEPTQQDLVDAELIREVNPRIDLVDGVARAVPGEVCEGVALSSPPPAAADADACARVRATLELAIEAFLARFDRLPDNEQDLIDAGMLRDSYPTYDVVYGEIVPGDGSPCP